MNVLSTIRRLSSVVGASIALTASVRADVATATPPAVDHYVYLRFIPKVSELAQDAKINGLTILRIDELPDRVIVSYQYPDGHTATLGYALLGAERQAPSAVHPAQSTASYVVADRDPEIIYVSRPSTTVVYSNPWYNTWAPLAVGFGVGWATGYYGGYYQPYPYYGYYGGYYRGHSHGGYHGGGYKHGGYHGGGSKHGGGYQSSGGYGRGGSQGGRGR